MNRITSTGCNRAGRRHSLWSRSVLYLTCLSIFTGWPQLTCFGQDRLPVFPIPQTIELTGNDFRLDERVIIAVPEDASERDLFAARLLSAELSDRHRLALRVCPVSSLPNDAPYIVIGSEKNPLVVQAMQALNAPHPPEKAEGYALVVRGSTAVVAGRDEAGAFYGLQTLRQLLVHDEKGGLRLRAARIRDWPHTSFRGIRLYLPGRENITFFKRFLRDFMALYKFNRVILEVNAVMRFDRHPELNAGWIELANSMNTTRRSLLWGPKYMNQNSVHHDAGDGGVLEQEEVADIVSYARQQGLEVIPEVPSLAHSYYLLTRHRELAEAPELEWPDAYCPLNPKSYELLFDVLDEVIEVFQPKTVHIGHDEWKPPIGVCPRCGDKDHRELFGEDVRKVYGYLKGRGLEVMMWHDQLLESSRGKGVKRFEYRKGYEYHRWGALTPEQVNRLIPKDILVGNWFWRGEKAESELHDFGFKQIFANMTPEVNRKGNYGERLKRANILGGAPSSWAATTEDNIGKDLIDSFLGCANLLWSSHWPADGELDRIVDALKPDVRVRLSGVRPPSEEGDPIVPVTLASSVREVPAQIGLPHLRGGAVAAGARRFELAGGGQPRAIVVGSLGEGPELAPPESKPIPIGEDATSLLFLHAAARQGANLKAYKMIYNFADTSELLGWYEVEYEDGFVITVPVRYGVNIASFDAASAPYRADAVECGGGAGALVRFLPSNG
ncbi:MAG TPA: beta-N-acetylhexosaminidase [Acidobacteriota bacterium]|nr:beta-N-acetylhexosaminidase [Acidobacteriota bacterium]